MKIKNITIKKKTYKTYKKYKTYKTYKTKQKT